MKKTRDTNRNGPDYIDLFADEPGEEDAAAENLFDEESDGGRVSRTKKTRAKQGKPEKTTAKRPAAEEDAFELDDEFETDEEFTEEKPAKKKGLFARAAALISDEDEDDEDDIWEDDEEEEPVPAKKPPKKAAGKEPAPEKPKKKGLFSRAAALVKDEDDEDDDWDDEDYKDEEPNVRKPSINEPVNEEPLPGETAQEKPSRKGLFARAAALIKDEDDDEEDEDDWDDETPPAFTPLRKPGEDDEDWDIGENLSDETAAEDNAPADKTEEGEKEIFLFDSEEDEEPASGAEELGFEDNAPRTFVFDHYGRRKNLNSKSRYGRRKNAPHAAPVVVRNETASDREEREAEERAVKRESIRERELNKLRRERKETFLRELRQRLTTAAMLIALGIMLAIAAFFVLRVTSIEVDGSSIRYSNEEILARSGLVRGRHILLQDTDEAEQRLNADPYLNASVRYIFPNKITITVQERRGLGVVQWGPNNEYLALIDKEGSVLEATLSSGSAASYPLVRGLVVTRVLAGSKIGDDADEQVQSTLDMLTKLDEYGLIRKISTLDMTETMGISMYTPENYRIEVGNVSDLDTKLSRLKKNWAAIMNQAAAYRSDVITIYLYSKNGVTISPHDVGYEVPTEEEMNAPAALTVEEFGAVPGTLEYGLVTTTPEPTPEAPATPPPFNSGPFSG